MTESDDSVANRNVQFSYAEMPEANAQRIAPPLGLLASQRVVEARNFDPAMPRKHLPAFKAIMDLTATTAISEIGLHGPSNAASVTEADKGIAELNLYRVFFPRDAHIAAFFIRERFPHLTESTVLASLAFTGVRDNLGDTVTRDEQELWKVPHEIRDAEHDPRAIWHTKEKGWGWPYFGAIDTTGKNINAIAYLALQPGGLAFLGREYTGMDNTTHTVEEALEGHINWMRSRMDLNPEGLVEALWLNPKHHANQTWADSPDSFHHSDGSWASHYPEQNFGVASVEVQAEVYDALIGARDVYRALAVDADAKRKQHLEHEVDDLTRRASRLREIVLTEFWVPDEARYGGFFARGTDRDEQGRLRPLAIRTSDMGHLLTSRILDGDTPEVVAKREAVMRNLFSPEMLAPNGLRTLSSDSLRFWQNSYHNGSSWPWVSYYVARGLERHGYYGLSYELKKRVWSLYDATKLLPEYGTGSDNPQERLVTQRVVIADPSLGYQESYQISQPAQEIQAWTAAAILAMKYEQGDRSFGRSGAIPIRATDPQKRRFEEAILGQSSPDHVLP